MIEKKSTPVTQWRSIISSHGVAQNSIKYNAKLKAREKIEPLQTTWIREIDVFPDPILSHICRAMSIFNRNLNKTNIVKAGKLKYEWMATENAR